MDKATAIKKLEKVWKNAKSKGLDCHDEVDEWIKLHGRLTDYQDGYLAAKMEEIGNALSSDSEDWMHEVKSVLQYLL